MIFFRLFYMSGQLWGSIENLNMIVQRILLSNTSAMPVDVPASTILAAENRRNGKEVALSEDLIRLSRLCFILTFKAVQENGHADQLVTQLKDELIDEKEQKWLLDTTSSSRPLLVVTWMERFMVKLEEEGYDVPRHLGALAGMQLNNTR